jgi:hypothetical protein
MSQVNKNTITRVVIVWTAILLSVLFFFSPIGIAMSYSEPTYLLFFLISWIPAVGTLILSLALTEVFED